MWPFGAISASIAVFTVAMQGSDGALLLRHSPEPSAPNGNDQLEEGGDSPLK